MTAAQGDGLFPVSAPDEISEDSRTDFRPLPQRVAAKLREKILLGEFPPGAAIPERETAAALGVSRTPLREALRILGSEGLVDIRAARSPVVTDPSPGEVLDLYSVMRVLEALAGELACLKATEAQISAVGRAHRRLSKIDPAQDTLAFFKADQEFHACIVAGAGNVPLVKTHAEYNARLWRARFMTSGIFTDRDRIIHDHSIILAGLEARDTRWTASALETHLRSARARVERLLSARNTQPDRAD